MGVDAGQPLCLTKKSWRRQKPIEGFMRSERSDMMVDPVVLKYKKRRDARLKKRMDEKPDSWITTETGSHIPLDENGKSIGGAGGKLKGKSFSGADNGGLNGTKREVKKELAKFSVGTKIDVGDVRFVKEEDGLWTPEVVSQKNLTREEKMDLSSGAFDEEGVASFLRSRGKEDAFEVSKPGEKGKESKAEGKKVENESEDFNSPFDLCDNEKSPYYLNEKERKEASNKLSQKYGDVEMNIFKISKRLGIPKMFIRHLARSENIRSAEGIIRFCEKYGI